MGVGHREVPTGGIGPALDHAGRVDHGVVEGGQHGGALGQRDADLAAGEAEGQGDRHRLGGAGSHERPPLQPDELEHGGVEPVGGRVGLEDLGEVLGPRLHVAGPDEELDRLREPALRRR